MCNGRAGRARRKVDPRPGSDSTVASPPWARAMARTRLRPRPRPALGAALIAAVEAVPDPGQVLGRDARAVVRALEDDAVPFARGRAATRGRPGGVYLTALSTRLARAWRRRARSPATLQARRGLHRRGPRPCPRPRPRRARPSRAAGPPTSRGSRRRAMVPVSASEMSMSVGQHGGHAVALLDAGRRGPPAPPPAARPREARLSAVARSRCRGVRRSWATLSREPLIPAISASIRSSISLASRPEVVEGVAVAPHRHAGRDLAGAHDAAEDRRQPAHGERGPSGWQERARRRRQQPRPPRRPGPPGRGSGPGCRRAPRSSCPPRRACRRAGGPRRPRSRAAVPGAGHAGEDGLVRRLPVSRTTRPSVRPGQPIPGATASLRARQPAAAGSARRTARGPRPRARGRARAARLRGARR